MNKVIIMLAGRRDLAIRSSEEPTPLSGADGTGWQEAHDYGERALQYHQSLHDG